MPTLTDHQLTALYDRHAAMVYRVCFSYMKNPTETEDAVQETFIKVMRAAPEFESDNHEKAWLVRTAANVCKDTLKRWWRRKVSFDNETDQLQASAPDATDTTLLAVLSLPDKYKSVVYLFYYEGYATAEIARFLGKPESTVRNHLSEARKQLRQILGELNEED
ncbi:MAG: RNA polymerase sigma factor [Propionibacteriaceae bacterium]|jgi:RNA polymerase sigma-70 factor (ECF subfamily)|nr:RNA polymerase sigma factor [Propionibacteriaceae bacterium]